MALATFADLQASVASWLHRDDLTAAIPDFITLAESRINRKLRVRQQMTATTLSTVASTASVALPADWLQWHSLRVTAPASPLEYMPGTLQERTYAPTDIGCPTTYTIRGDSLILAPVPDTVYSIAAVYYAKVPALSDSATTNWLLTDWPGLYLFATLAESAPFLGNDARIPVWESKYASELDSVLRSDRESVSAGSPIRVRAG